MMFLDMLLIYLGTVALAYVTYGCFLEAEDYYRWREWVTHVALWLWPVSLVLFLFAVIVMYIYHKWS